MMEALPNATDTWSKSTRNKMEMIAVNGRGLEIMKKEELGKKIERWDTKIWEEEMIEKSSLKFIEDLHKIWGKWSIFMIINQNR